MGNALHGNASTPEIPTKTHVAFVGDSYIVRFEAAIGVHPDIPQN